MVYHTFEISEELNNKLFSYSKMFDVNQKDLLASALNRLFNQIENDKTDEFVKTNFSKIELGIKDVENGDVYEGKKVFSELLGL